MQGGRVLKRRKMGRLTEVDVGKGRGGEGRGQGGGRGESRRDKGYRKRVGMTRKQREKDIGKQDTSKRGNKVGENGA